MADEGTGVFYKPEDYAGVFRRLFIDGVDAFVIIVLTVLLALFLQMVWQHDPSGDLVFFVLMVALWFTYFVILKRSKVRTIGYLVGGTRIVSLQGERPTVLSLVIRLMFVVVGPVNFLVDLLWIPSDPCRQALRDKFAHTYVIRKSAQPLGTGQIVYRTYTLFGGTMLFQEVQQIQDSV